MSEVREKAKKMEITRPSGHRAAVTHTSRRAHAFGGHYRVVLRRRVLFDTSDFAKKWQVAAFSSHGEALVDIDVRNTPDS